MILAAGLSPAWQQILVVPALQVGEVNRAAESHWCGSGKVLNVGLALHHLGADVHVLAPLGGLPGRCIREEFHKQNIAATWIDTAAPTRVCTTLLDPQAGQTTELVENAHAMREDELQSFGEAFMRLARDAQIIVVSGSLPARTDSDFWRPLLRDVAERCVLDIRGPELLAVLSARPLLVKPNREETGRTLGRHLADEADVAAAMDRLHSLGAANVLVTDGSRPVRLLSSEGVSTLTPPTVPLVNPIGCGDCLAAGAAWALAQGRPMRDAVAVGLAAASENAQQLLPARLDPDRVRSMLASIR
jgi:1-phosphofructokinase family hexose kinase